MNPAPRIHGHHVYAAGHTVATSCGREAEQNREASFWQSRHPRHERIELTDLRALARATRGKPQ